MATYRRTTNDFANTVSSPSGMVREFWLSYADYQAGKKPSMVSNHNGNWVNQSSRRTNCWVTQQAKGAFKPFTPYSRTSTVVTRPYSVHTRRNVNTVYRDSGTSPVNIPDVANAGPFLTIYGYAKSPSTNTLRRLNTEVLLKVKNSKINLGESLAESRSTINHLSKTVSSVARALLAARRGNWKEVAKSLSVPMKRKHVSKEAANRWMEYQFAWMPLLGDIKGAHDVLTKGLRERDQLFRAVRVLKDHYYKDLGQGSSVDQSVTYRAVIYARVDKTKMSQLGQIGLTSPLQVAWALQPYSFVVDWMMPVGNLLEALTATFGLDFVGGGYGTRVSSKVIHVDSFSGDTIAGSPLRREASTEAYVRASMSGFPAPAPYFKSPFSTSHLTSALAMLKQLNR